VYDKLVRTALRYTPVVLEHHVPYKALPNGRLYGFSLLAMLSHDLHIANSKAPTQTHKLKTLQKLITSFFHNTIHLISQLSDTELLKMAVTESTKILPYVSSSRKTVKLYLKASITCFSLYSLIAHTWLRHAWTCGLQLTTAYGLLRFVLFIGLRLRPTNLFSTLY
jgi:nucleolar complex protein 2